MFKLIHTPKKKTVLKLALFAFLSAIALAICVSLLDGAVSFAIGRLFG